jgi:hypothetical protein
MTSCDLAHATHCQRCGPLYCVPHLQEAVVPVLQHGERGSDVLRLCLHCIARAEIWAAQS